MMSHTFTAVRRVHPTRLRSHWLLIAIGLAIAGLAISMAVGPASIHPVDVLKVLLNYLPRVHLHHNLSDTTTAILTQIRIPRVLLAGMVGAVLATAGGAYQATFRNPLADPYLLGVASGAGLGVTLALTGRTAELGTVDVTVTLAAFVGALVAVGAAYLLGTSGGQRSGASLILAGVAIGALGGALQTFLLQRNDETIRDVYSWVLGRFNVSGWSEVILLLPFALVTLTILIASARRLDLLALGDEEAESLGIGVTQLRTLVVLSATLGTAAAVSVSGLIGFVGIIVPHAIRLVVGPSYRRILPLATILGIPFLALADTAARTALSPAEVPIGVITAVVGAPFFLILLRAARVRPT